MCDEQGSQKHIGIATKHAHIHTQTANQPGSNTLKGQNTSVVICNVDRKTIIHVGGDVKPIKY